MRHLTRIFSSYCGISAILFVLSSIIYLTNNLTTNELPQKIIETASLFAWWSLAMAILGFIIDIQTGKTFTKANHIGYSICLISAVLTVCVHQNIALIILLIIGLSITGLSLYNLKHIFKEDTQIFRYRMLWVPVVLTTIIAVAVWIIQPNCYPSELKTPLNTFAYLTVFIAVFSFRNRQWSSAIINLVLGFTALSFCSFVGKENISTGDTESLQYIFMAVAAIEIIATPILIRKGF